MIPVNNNGRLLLLVETPSNSQVRLEPRGQSQYIVTNKVTLWAASYLACVVYVKTIIHLSVGESDGCLPPLR